MQQTFHVRKARASAVLVERIPSELADWFLEWQQGISAAAATLPGYQATDVYPPTVPESDEWVVVLHYDTVEHLQLWLESSLRAEWLQKLTERGVHIELRTMPGGFGAWFSNHTRKPAGPPTPWKMALTVLLTLYPTVMLAAVLTSPLRPVLGFPVLMLLNNVVCVAILQWGLMPFVTQRLYGWYRADFRKEPLRVLGVALGILLFLLGLVLLFQNLQMTD